MIYLLLVEIRHNASFWISDIVGLTQKGTFYALGGLWEAFLCLALARYLWKEQKHLGVFACVIGASEGLQMAVCRMLFVPGQKNLCDQSGLPIGATLVSLYALLLCAYVGRKNMNNRALILVPIISAAEVSYLTNHYAGLGLLALCFSVWRVYGRQP